MATEIRKQLTRAIREQTEYFAKRVRPELDSLERAVPPHERLERITPQVREKYEALCHTVDDLKVRGAETLDAVLSNNEALMLQMVPLMIEACQIERELGLLLPAVADLRPDGTCCAITDSRIYTRAVRLHEMAEELLRLEDMTTGEKGEVYDRVYRAIREARDIAKDLIDKNPICDVVFYQLDADAAVLDEYLSRNRRKLRDLGKRAHIAQYDTSTA